MSGETGHDRALRDLSEELKNAKETGLDMSVTIIQSAIDGILDQKNAEKNK